MSKLATKADLLVEIQTQRRRLDSNLAALTPEEMLQPGVCGDWSVKDVLAHLFAWEQMFLEWYRAGRRGETPETPAPGLTWGQLDTVNQQIYERYREDTLETILAKYADSYHEMETLLELVPEEELLTPGKYTWLNGARLIDWTAPNTCNHYQWAKTLIRNWKKTK